MRSKVDQTTSATPVAPHWELLQQLIGVLADWVWELDTELRFTRVAGELGADADLAPQLPGSALWDLGFKLADDSDNWELQRQKMGDRLSFRALLLRRQRSDGSIGFISLSGAASFDSDGKCNGYRGTAQDVTSTEVEQQLLQQYKAMVDASPDVVFLSDYETQLFLYGNETARELTGFSEAEIRRLRGHQITRRSAEAAKAMFDAAKEAGVQGVTDRAHFATSKDGSRKGWWEPHHRAIKLNGQWCVITVSREVTGRVLAEEAAQRAKRMYAALSATNHAIMRARSSNDMYFAVCKAAVEAGSLPSACIMLAEPGASTLLPVAAAGAGKSKILGSVFPVQLENSSDYSLNGSAFATGMPCFSNDFANDPRTKAWHAYGEHMGIKSCASIPIFREGRPTGTLFLCAGEKRAFDEEIVGLLTSMTENIAFGIQTLEQETDRERAEERVRFLATHDSLTGLPNRLLFGELIDQATTIARRHKQNLAVMFIDLDRFKLVNDTLGHAAGDILLKEMSSRLRATLRESDVLARMGGDEFVILLHDIKVPEDAATVARKILDAALAPLTIEGQECRVTASIGISIYPEHGEEHTELMKNADTAMYIAKDSGKNAFQFYAPEMQSLSNERLALEAGLRNAIANDEFTLNYQAKLDLKTNKISGVEALLRWNHPTLGNISPQRFIPLCEENGLIVPIGRWVLQTACKQNVEWQRQGLPPITMAVNLSARQFSDPDLLSDVRKTLAETGMAPTLLELELTESMVMLNPAKTISILTELKALGVRIALDDFGVGYSSLAQIKGFPIDTLKVDRSFIRNLPESSKDRAITQAIISMARSLSLSVIAEGVETQAQESFLRDHACDESQGYYFSKPATAEVFASLLKRQTSDN